MEDPEPIFRVQFLDLIIFDVWLTETGVSHVVLNRPAQCVARSVFLYNC